MKPRRNQKKRRPLNYAGKERTGGNKSYSVQTSDFSDIENSQTAVKEIQKLVSQAGLAAASEAKAIGIPRVFARNNEIIREYPDGRIEVLVSFKTPQQKVYFRRFKSGILHARKK